MPYSGPGMPPYAVPPQTTSGIPSSLLQPLPERKSHKTAIFAALGVVLAILVCAAGAFALLQASPRSGASNAGSTGPSAAPTSTSSNGSSERVLLRDPLTSNQYGWADDTHCHFASDGYHVVDGYLCYAPVNVLTAADISVSAQQLSGDVHEGYGIVFRRASKGNYYTFVADGNGKWTFGKVVNGAYTTLLDWSYDAAIHAGATASNTFEVRTRGTHFDFFINGASVGHADDSSFASGVCGVAGVNQGETVFTNFLIQVPQ
jgi:hypothetical protein